MTKRDIYKLTRTVIGEMNNMLYMSENKSLAEFIRAKMNEQNLSTYDVARKSGNKVSATAISKILNGEVAASSVKTLSHIAVGLGIEEQDIFNVAMGKGDRPLHYQIYAERFDAEGLSDSEWQMLELYFRDYVKRWQEFQADREAGKFVKPEGTLAPVVARISPGTTSKEDVRRMINNDEIDEIERRIKKKKVG